jgi:hypothetical protein
LSHFQGQLKQILSPELILFLWLISPKGYLLKSLHAYIQ